MKRRAQAEGRIGIFKNAILDGSLYEREFEGKGLKVDWAVLEHNLWKMAAMINKAHEELEAAA